jgi:site-specific DNA recombinase
MGKAACKGGAIPMDKLDHLVTDHIAERFLVHDRITALLADIAERRAMADSEVQDRIDQLSREATAAEEKLRRLYALVEDGITDLDDVLRARLADIKADRVIGRGAHSTGSRAKVRRSASIRPKSNASVP